MDEQIINKKVKVVVEEVEYPPIIEIQKRINEFFMNKFLEEPSWLSFVVGFWIKNNVNVIDRPYYKKTCIGENDYVYEPGRKGSSPWITSFILEVAMNLDGTTHVMSQEFVDSGNLGHLVSLFKHFTDELEWTKKNTSSQSKYSFK